jgi:3',5'-cyclic-AMP phosphodiesterase
MGVVAPTHVLIQLTDLHLRDEHEPLRDGVDTFALLQKALGTIAATEPVGALLFTGDLADKGNPFAYRRLRAAVASSGLDVPVLYIPGNHDDREAVRTELLGQLPSTAPINQVLRLGGLRILALDSTVRGHGHGELTEKQLAWLRDQLAEPAPEGTVLVLHHPPLPSVVPQIRRYELRDRESLAAAVTGSDVRFVLGGHTHVVGAGTLAGVPVWSGGPVFTTIDALMPTGLPDGAVRTFATPSMSRIDVHADAVTAISVPIAEPMVILP